MDWVREGWTNSYWARVGDIGERKIGAMIMERRRS